jgi:hypothetical protein
MVDPALVAELQALAARVVSPFNRALMTLELSRQQTPADALPVLAALVDSPVAQQRPGLQLHATALACQAAGAAGQPAEAARHARRGQALLAHCAPFDMAMAEAHGLLHPHSPHSES